MLQEMEAKQLEQTRAIMATKKEENVEDLYKGPNYVVPEEVSENVRTIQVEVSSCGDNVVTSISETQPLAFAIPQQRTFTYGSSE